jgi:hypothetical protein
MTSQRVAVLLFLIMKCFVSEDKIRGWLVYVRPFFFNYEMEMYSVFEKKNILYVIRGTL